MGLDVVFHMSNLDFGDATVANGDSHWPTKDGESLDFKGGNALSSGSESTLLFSQTVANHFSANVRDGKLDVESHTETKGSFSPSAIKELLPTNVDYHKFLPFSIKSLTPEDCATICASLLPHPTSRANLQIADSTDSTAVSDVENSSIGDTLQVKQDASSEQEAPSSIAETVLNVEVQDRPSEQEAPSSIANTVLNVEVQDRPSEQETPSSIAETVLNVEVNRPSEQEAPSSIAETVLNVEVQNRSSEQEAPSSIAETVLNVEVQNRSSEQEELKDVYQDIAASNINTESEEIYHDSIEAIYHDSSFSEDAILSEYKRDIDEMLA